MLNIPDTVINFQALRLECIERCYVAPLEVWKDEELNELGKIAKRFVQSRQKPGEDWRLNPCVRMVVRDIEELPTPMPKWASLIAWLTPEGAASYAPEMIAEIARRALECSLVP